MIESRAKAPSSPLRPMLLALLAAFVFGAALAGYGVYRWSIADQPASGVAASDARGAVAAPPVALPDAEESEAPPPAVEAPTVEEVERVAEQQGGLDQRLAAAEQRLTRLDLQAQAAAGNAARAESLLIAFAARRAMERGEELGFLADQLRLRFGDALPNAVRTVISNAEDPVTLDRLIARLDGLGPSLANTNEAVSWATIRRELGQLFVVRRNSTPSPQPQRRLDRARLFLQSGRVEAAIDEVSRLPGAESAANWIADAERYAASQQALELIETSAVLEPRLLRDGSGTPVEQGSPAEGAPAR